MSAYDNKDPELFTVWWVNRDRDADMDCGSFESQHEAEKALPGILVDMLDQCAADEDGRESIMAGSFFLEWPEDADGNRGQSIEMAWPVEDV